MTSDSSHNPDCLEGDLLEAVQSLAEQGKYAASIALLDRAADSAAVQRQRLILSILKHAQHKEWHQVLELDETTDKKQVQQQFRKLAKQVHPDKCKLPSAEAAFKAICLAAAEMSSSGGTSTNGDEDVHWWEAWDDDAVDRKRKRASSPDINEEDAVWHASLHEMPVEDLKKEVARLQASIFEKKASSSGAQPPIQRRQQRLRQARTILSKMLEESGTERSSNGRGMAGGFF